MEPIEQTEQPAAANGELEKERRWRLVLGVDDEETQALSRRDRRLASALDALYGPDGALREELAIRVLVHESDAQNPGCPCFEVQLGDRAWLLEEPNEKLTIPQTTEAWKALAPQYEVFTEEFTAAVRELLSRLLAERCAASLRSVG